MACHAYISTWTFHNIIHEVIDNASYNKHNTFSIVTRSLLSSFDEKSFDDNEE